MKPEELDALFAEAQAKPVAQQSAPQKKAASPKKAEAQDPAMKAAGAGMQSISNMLGGLIPGINSAASAVEGIPLIGDIVKGTRAVGTDLGNMAGGGLNPLHALEAAGAGAIHGGLSMAQAPWNTVAAMNQYGNAPIHMPTVSIAEQFAGAPGISDLAQMAPGLFGAGGVASQMALPLGAAEATGASALGKIMTSAGIGGAMGGMQGTSGALAAGQPPGQALGQGLQGAAMGAGAGAIGSGLMQAPRMAQAGANALKKGMGARKPAAAQPQQPAMPQTQADVQVQMAEAQYRWAQAVQQQEQAQQQLAMMQQQMQQPQMEVTGTMLPSVRQETLPSQPQPQQSMQGQMLPPEPVAPPPQAPPQPLALPDYQSMIAGQVPWINNELPNMNPYTGQRMQPVVTPPPGYKGEGQVKRNMPSNQVFDQVFAEPPQTVAAQNAQANAQPTQSTVQPELPSVQKPPVVDALQPTPQTENVQPVVQQPGAPPKKAAGSKKRLEGEKVEASNGAFWQKTGGPRNWQLYNPDGSPATGGDGKPINRLISKRPGKGDMAQAEALTQQAEPPQPKKAEAPQGGASQPASSTEQPDFLKAEVRGQNVAPVSAEMAPGLERLSAAKRDYEQAKANWMADIAAMESKGFEPSRYPGITPEEKLAIEQKYGAEIEDVPEMNVQLMGDKPLATPNPIDNPEAFGAQANLRRQAFMQAKEAYKQAKAAVEGQFFAGTKTGQALEHAGISVLNRLAPKAFNESGAGIRAAKAEVAKLAEETGRWSDPTPDNIRGMAQHAKVLADIADAKGSTDEAAAFREMAKNLAKRPESLEKEGWKTLAVTPGDPSALLMAAAKVGKFVKAKGDSLLQLSMVQRNSDIYNQYMPEVGSWFMRQMGRLEDAAATGVEQPKSIEQATLFKLARRLDDAEILDPAGKLADLTDKQRQYLAKRNPILDEMESVFKEIESGLKEGNGPDRLLRVVRSDLEQLSKTKAMTDTQKLGNKMLRSIYDSYTVGNPEIHGLHVVEALAHGLGENPIGFIKGAANIISDPKTRAWLGAYKGSGAMRRIRDEAVSLVGESWATKQDPTRFISKIPGFKQVFSVIEGTPIENAKVALMRASAAEKVAKDMGFKGGRELISDYVDGKLTPEQALEMHIGTMEYLDRTIGYSPPGFVNQDVFARHGGAKWLAPFMTTRTQQARFLNKTILSGVKKAASGDIRGAANDWRKYGMTIGIITLFSGENSLGREFEEALNAANPEFAAQVKEQLDKMAFVGHAMRTDVSHMQPAMVPALWSGQTMIGSTINQVKKGAESAKKFASGRAEDSDYRRMARGAAMAASLAGLSTLFGGKIGTEAMIKLFNRVKEGSEGERTLWAFPKTSVFDSFSDPKKPLASKKVKTNLSESLYDWAMAGESPELGEFINEMRRQSAAEQFMKEHHPEQHAIIDEMYRNAESDAFGDIRAIEAEMRKYGKAPKGGSMLPANPMIKRDWLKMLEQTVPEKGETKTPSAVPTLPNEA